ncbi:hypothetical protein, partial [Streptomyces sp. NPDC048106]|uniref:hypothetical protein n=1 Tax=Streptomyces sp. NPDC048106 TaxID=3155750 RepID=UPI0034547270
EGHRPTTSASTPIAPHTRSVTCDFTMHGSQWSFWGHWPEVFNIAAHSAQTLGDPLLEATQLNSHAWALLLCDCSANTPPRHVTTAMRPHSSRPPGISTAP